MKEKIQEIHFTVTSYSNKKPNEVVNNYVQNLLDALEEKQAELKKEETLRKKKKCSSAQYKFPYDKILSVKKFLFQNLGLLIKNKKSVR